MAERRMFAKSIIDTDAFLGMPMSTQALYFHLCMRADDDGFVSNPRNIQRMVGSAEDDLKLLVAKRYILVFESGVIVIKHWRLHNYIQRDRYKPTLYSDEKNELYVKKDGAYTDHPTDESQPCIQSVSKLDTQVRLGKDRLGKDRLNITGANRPRFSPPSVDDVRSYCKERGNNVDPDGFVDFYSSKGWKIGKDTMKDWKAEVRTWERREPNGGNGKNPGNGENAPTRWNVHSELDGL